MIDMTDKDNFEAGRFGDHMNPLARNFCIAFRS